MKAAISNIALSAFDHKDELHALADLGYAGIEVAPSRVWPDTWHGLSARDVDAYRRTVEAAGLKVVGLHSLFFDQPHLGMFKGPELESETLDFLAHLSEVCRDLGGRSLIYGSRTARTKGPRSNAEAIAEAADFMDRLCGRIADHGTCYCFEPLETAVADFINSALDSLAVVTAVDHPALRVQLDAKALVANDEDRQAIFEQVAPYLAHFHANEPDLGELGHSGAVDHAKLGGFLRAVGYDGYVSAEQRMVDEADPVGAAARSLAVLKDGYGTV